MPDLYSIMGLTRRATGDEVKAAYRALAKRYHPDVNAGDTEGERRTKEINRAYATLGDPEARAAYDLELARQRAAARHGFWRSAVTGAATFIVTVSSIWVMVVWRQNASIQQSQRSEPAVLAGDESPVKNPPAEAVANRGPAGSGDHDGRDAPRETAIASVPELFGEPPSSTTRVMPSTPQGDRETQAAAPEKIASAPPSELAQPPQGQETLPSAAENATPRTEFASAPPPEVAAVQPMPAPAIDPKPIREPIPRDTAPSSEPVQFPLQPAVSPAPAETAPPRTELASAALLKVGDEPPISAAAVPKLYRDTAPPDADRKTAAVGRVPKKSGRQFNAPEPAASMQGNRQGSERGLHLVSKAASALRWPSADEPFVNVGGRNR